MEAIADTRPSTPLSFARHVVGMMILALASPYVWYGSQGAMTWFSTWLTPLVIAGVAFGLYALFFTKRAKEAWPGRFFMLAWVLLALVVAAPYLETFNQRIARQAVQAAPPAAPIQSSLTPTQRTASEEQWTPAPPNLKPFDGKLDGDEK